MCAVLLFKSQQIQQIIIHKTVLALVPKVCSDTNTLISAFHWSLLFSNTDYTLDSAKV